MPPFLEQCFEVPGEFDEYFLASLVVLSPHDVQRRKSQLGQGPGTQSLGSVEARSDIRRHRLAAARAERFLFAEISRQLKDVAALVAFGATEANDYFSIVFK